MYVLLYLVSNNLKPQRRFTMTGLLPSTEYHLQVEAHNIAGSSTGEYSFYTLTKDGGKLQNDPQGKSGWVVYPKIGG